MFSFPLVVSSAMVAVAFITKLLYLACFVLIVSFAICSIKDVVGLSEFLCYDEYQVVRAEPVGGLENKAVVGRVVAGLRRGGLKQALQLMSSSGSGFK